MCDNNTFDAFHYRIPKFKEKSWCDFVDMRAMLFMKINRIKSEIFLLNHNMGNNIDSKVQLTGAMQLLKQYIKEMIVVLERLNDEVKLLKTHNVQHDEQYGSFGMWYKTSGYPNFCEDLVEWTNLLNTLNSDDDGLHSKTAFQSSTNISLCKEMRLQDEYFKN